jgi:hypothetical protein
MGHGMQPGLEGREHRLCETAEQIRERAEFRVVEDSGGVTEIAHAQPLHEIHDLLAQGSDRHSHHPTVVRMGAPLH